MALDAHLVELSEKHRALDRKIEEEQARPMADPQNVPMGRLDAFDVAAKKLTIQTEFFSRPAWRIETDSTAPSKPNVLKQSGNATFPVCIKDDTNLKDGFVEVKFKPVSGKEDQAGGVVWRWKDRDSYYVARANALENNVSLYYTQNGRRVTLKYVDAPVARNAWHTLRVEFSAKKIRVILDGKPRIEMEDDHIAGAGAVGVWTKADSVTLFDDFAYGSR